MSPQEVIIVDPNSEQPPFKGPGVYSSVKPDPTTTKALVKWMTEAGIPNPVPAEKLHSTIIYSREAFAGYQPRMDITVVTSQPKRDEWGYIIDRPYSLQRMGEDKNALALCFDSPELENQFYQALNLGASWDHADHKRHVTLTYDVGDFDFTKLDLPTFELVFEPESVTVLADDWSDTFKIDAEICKVNDEQRIVYGWASVVEKDGQLLIDHQGDLIHPEDLEKAAYQYVLDSRRGDLMHVEKGAAQLVSSIVFTKDIQKMLGINLNKVGWLVGFKVFSDEVWEGVKSGIYKDFSIGGRAIRELLE